MTGQGTLARACVLGDIDLVRALGLWGIPCVVVAKPGALSRGSRFAQQALEWRDAWEQPTELLDVLLRFAAEESEPPVLFYQEDRELLLVSRHRNRLCPSFRFVVADSTLVEDLVDKARFQALAERLGLPVPPARRLDPATGIHEADLDFRYPVIVKPLTRRSDHWEQISGAKAVEVAGRTALRELCHRLAAARVPVLVQELIPGAESQIESYHVYVDERGAIAGEFTGRKIRTHPCLYGHSTAVVITEADDVTKLGRALTERLGLRGVAKFDFKRGLGGRLYLLEVNPRFTLWNHPGAVAGVNLPAMVYADLVGIDRPRAPRARAGVRWCKPWSDCLAAQAAGMPLRHWLPWAMECEAKRAMSWDDPMPLVYGGLWRCLHRVARMGSASRPAVPVPLARAPDIGQSDRGVGPQPSVTVILPCRNEARYIGSCLDSVLQSAYPRHRITVVVADGMSDDGTRAILAQYAAAHPQISVIDNPARIAPSGLNAALRIATGEIILRMDAHTVYPPDYIPRLIAALEETGADNVGTRVITVPAGEGAMASAIAIGLSHPLGVGNSHFRIGAPRARWVDHVPFGCWRRTLFQRIGLFDEELARDQDVEFNGRIINHGGRILLLPEVATTYYARRSLGQLARMLYQYGYFKPLVARKLGRILTVRQMVPSLFLLGLAGTGGLSLWFARALIPLAAILASYATLVLASAGLAARRHGLRCGVALLAVFPTMHACYGIGYLRGVCEHLLHLRLGPRSPAPVALTR